MSKAHAIALPVTPFIAAALSFKHFAAFIADRMYGTKERTNATLMVALLMTVLGIMLQRSAPALMSACAV